MEKFQERHFKALACFKDGEDDVKETGTEPA